jgi:hypothetical protein
VSDPYDDDLMTFEARGTTLARGAAAGLGADGQRAHLVLVSWPRPAEFNRTPLEILTSLRAWPSQNPYSARSVTTVDSSARDAFHTETHHPSMALSRAARVAIRWLDLTSVAWQHHR